MNIALFTSNHLRHKYFAAEIAKQLSLKLIVSEEKNNAIQEISTYNEAERELLENHFQKRQASEEQFFGEYQNFPSAIAIEKMEFGTINSQNTLNLLKIHKIDCVLLFGTSIIKADILQKYPDKVINLHLGLSPYYKGSGTNFFPIVNNEFECIGATIHLAIKSVDAGAILHQFRPDNIQDSDDLHAIGNKTIQMAGKIYPKIVQHYLLGKITLQAQNEVEGSKIYRLKDFTPDTIRTANKIIINGGVAEYLENKNQRMASKPIVSNCNE
ncbi:formyltransferase family protein [Flavobacterium psychrotolerans]|nr:formyltransferase family protein [Flavobacterium psychrotolerans]